MLVAAAICPAAPVLMPELAAGAARELDAVRAACDAAVAGLPGGTEIIVVGAGSVTRRHPADAAGSLAPYGLDVLVGPPARAPTLPLSLTVGRWLLDRAGREPVAYQEVATNTPPDSCAVLGAALVIARTALLVMGDGSGWSLQTPVCDDGRGTAYDDRVAAAVATADQTALLGLSPADDVRLWVSGRAAWQVLAGAARPGIAGAITWRGAPYGVGYLVGCWR